MALHRKAQFLPSPSPQRRIPIDELYELAFQVRLISISGEEVLLRRCAWSCHSCVIRRGLWAEVVRATIQVVEC